LAERSLFLFSEAFLFSLEIRGIRDSCSLSKLPSKFVEEREKLFRGNSDEAKLHPFSKFPSEVCRRERKASGFLRNIYLSRQSK
ncbi:MAG: hypothetical protein AB1485_09110, partial [Candidatus Thermoplasmatota archaeon]